MTEEPASKHGWTEGRLLVPASLLVLLLTIAPALTGYYAFDDEGMLIYTTKQLASGAQLYENVISLYGPAFFSWLKLFFHAFGTSYAGYRLLTACCLVAAVLLVYRFGRGWLGPTAAAAGGLIWWSHGVPLVSESHHPGWLLSVGVGIMALGLQVWDRRRSPSLLIGIGVVLGLMAGLKANVAFFSLLVPLALFSGRSDHTPFRWMVTAGIALFLAALLTSAAPSQHGRVYLYWLPVAISALWAVVRVPKSKGRPTRLRHLGQLTLGCFIGTLLWFVPLVARSSVAGWVDCCLLRASRLPEIFSVPIIYSVSSPALWIGLGALIVPIVSRLDERRAPIIRRLVATGYGALLVLLALHIIPTETRLVRGVILGACILAPQLPGRDKPGPHLLSLLVPFEVLHAFPVAGNQVFFGMIFVPLLLLASMTENGLADRAGRKGPGWLERLGQTMAILLLVTALVPVLRQTIARREQPPLQPRNARGVHTRLAPAINAIVVRVRELVPPDTPLWTYPSLPSFYLWTERRSVTTLNFAPWGVLTRSEQQQIADSLSQVSHLVVCPQVAAWYRIHRNPTRKQTTHLEDQILDQFEPMEEAGQGPIRYQIWRRKAK